MRLAVDPLDGDPPGVGDDPRLDGNAMPGIGLEAVRPGDRRAVGGVRAAPVVPPQDERPLRDDRETIERPPRSGRAGELKAGVDLRDALGTTFHRPPQVAAEHVADGGEQRGHRVPLAGLHRLQRVAAASRRLEHQGDDPSDGIGEQGSSQVRAQRLDDGRPGIAEDRAGRRQDRGIDGGLAVIRVAGPPRQRGAARDRADDVHRPAVPPMRNASAAAASELPAALGRRTPAGIRSTRPSARRSDHAGSMPNGRASPLNSRLSPLPMSPRAHALTTCRVVEA